MGPTPKPSPCPVGPSLLPPSSALFGGGGQRRAGSFLLRPCGPLVHPLHTRHVTSARGISGWITLNNLELVLGRRGFYQEGGGGTRF
jgi:hypothetical protein